MAGLDVLEILIVLVVALVVIGPERLPAVMGELGRVMRELRSASNSVMRELTSTLDELPPAIARAEPPERPDDAARAAAPAASGEPGSPSQTE